MMSTHKHSLLDFTHLPDFEHIKTEDLSLALQDQIKQVEKTIEAFVAVDEAPNFDAFRPLMNEMERLVYVWRLAHHLHAVVDTPSLRDLLARYSPKLTEVMTTLCQNTLFYQRLKALANSASFSDLTPAQQQLIKNNVRDCYLSGAELNQTDKARFKAIQKEAVQLQLDFGQHVLDATDDFVLYLDDDRRLAGVPQDVQVLLASLASAEGKKGYKLTLQRPSYEPILQYAEDRDLRRALYEAYVIRASDLGKKEYDNTPLINAWLPLMRETATLLGFKTYAEVSLATKMADNPQQVIEFLRALMKKGHPFAQRDFESLANFAKDNLGIDQLEVWDIAYASEKMREKYYAVSQQEIKRYFPLPKVLSGLFALIEDLYHVKVCPATASTWHPDVQFYHVFDASMQLMGSFYLDLYARESKQEGAWVASLRDRFVREGKLQTPAAYLVCNFAHPIDDQPTRLTHEHVEILFHEMGHCLHHVLTQIDEVGVSGMDGVEWDAVELPSQFMENFCWEWDTLTTISEHEVTKAALPQSLYQKMLLQKNFQSGLQLLRQIELGLFDLLVHDAFEPTGDWMQLLNAIRAQTSVFKRPSFDRTMHSFRHIFAGGYTAGYYSYLWSEVLSADAYTAFEENKDNRQVIGQRFLKEILAVGGSRSAMESFRAFRGRDPDINSLLKQKGMTDDGLSAKRFNGCGLDSINRNVLMCSVNDKAKWIVNG